MFTRNLFAHILATLVVASFALIGCSDTASVPASSASSSNVSPLSKAEVVVTTLRAPVSFVLAGGTCGLASDVTANGTFHYVFRVTINANGRPIISMNWSAHGTASGADGSRYVFNYAANFRNIDPGFNTVPFIFDAVDHFNLIGQGAVPDLRVWIRGHFRVNEQGEVEIIQASQRGDFSCDPI